MFIQNYAEFLQDFIKITPTCHAVAILVMFFCQVILEWFPRSC